MPRTDDYTRARGRAEAKLGFYAHASTFVAVMALLVVINLLTWPGYFWAVWPMLGWGIALGLHAARAFLLPDRNGIVEAMTRRELLRGDKTRDAD